MRLCPYCGREPALVDEEGQGDVFYVSCPNDDCPGNHAFFADTAEKAIEAWNKRPEA